ncbi:unnamed protein product [Vitrella brassicaformis CCMP3155]|uniref:Uncharacterized protein n=4 Tax=Vitrella brassicaformis TaxID=1169539 RepID=A0A0G4EH95_VITBC|nr:unnamed protein product [Vitrella brassicaformis CCMP3155]|eukprot:CEL95395.1 unnamed protein product [Vitrella brassicaformis CCMP3155]
MSEEYEKAPADPTPREAVSGCGHAAAVPGPAHYSLVHADGRNSEMEQPSSVDNSPSYLQRGEGASPAKARDERLRESLEQGLGEMVKTCPVGPHASSAEGGDAAESDPDAPQLVKELSQGSKVEVKWPNSVEVHVGIVRSVAKVDDEWTVRVNIRGYSTGDGSAFAVPIEYVRTGSGWTRELLNSDTRHSRPRRAPLAQPQSSPSSPQKRPPTPQKRPRARPSKTGSPLTLSKDKRESHALKAKKTARRTRPQSEVGTRSDTEMGEAGGREESVCSEGLAGKADSHAAAAAAAASVAEVAVPSWPLAGELVLADTLQERIALARAKAAAIVGSDFDVSHLSPTDARTLDRLKPGMKIEVMQITKNGPEEATAVGWGPKDGTVYVRYRKPGWSTLFITPISAVRIGNEWSESIRQEGRASRAKPKPPFLPQTLDRTATAPPTTEPEPAKRKKHLEVPGGPSKRHRSAFGVSMRRERERGDGEGDSIDGGDVMMNMPSERFRQELSRAVPQISVSRPPTLDEWEIDPSIPHPNTLPVGSPIELKAPRQDMPEAAVVVAVVFDDKAGEWIVRYKRPDMSYIGRAPLRNVRPGRGWSQQQGTTGVLGLPSRKLRSPIAMDETSIDKGLRTLQNGSKPLPYHLMSRAIDHLVKERRYHLTRSSVIDFEEREDAVLSRQRQRAFDKRLKSLQDRIRQGDSSVKIGDLVREMPGVFLSVRWMWQDSVLPKKEIAKDLDRLRKLAREGPMSRHPSPSPAPSSVAAAAASSGGDIASRFNDMMMSVQQPGSSSATADERAAAERLVSLVRERNDEILPVAEQDRKDDRSDELSGVSGVSGEDGSGSKKPSEGAASPLQMLMDDI